MALKAIHDTLEEIPEAYRDLYTEKGGKHELTGIQGVKTPEDVGRVQRAIDKEKEEHKATKLQLKPWSELGKLEDIQASLDRLPELEAAAKGKLNEDEINAIAEKRADGIIQSKIKPVERDNNKLKSQVSDLETELTGFRTKDKQRTIGDQLRTVIQKEKLEVEFHDDVMMWGDRLFDVNDEGKAVTKENSGVVPGMSPEEWLTSMQEKRPRWWPGSRGGGSRGSGAGGGFTQNPWAHDHWNVTKQGQILNEKGSDVATRMAEAAGTKLGGLKPKAKK